MIMREVQRGTVETEQTLRPERCAHRIWNRNDESVGDLFLARDGEVRLVCGRFEWDIEAVVSWPHAPALRRMITIGFTLNWNARIA